MRIGLAVVWMFFHGLALAAPDKVGPESLPVPALERGPSGPSLALPPVPSFQLDEPDGDVLHPRYLRLRAKKYLDTDVKVRGYIVWIYDCIADNKRPKETRAQTQRRIDADPTLCERPKFYLATTRDTRPEQALWVVDVPRPPNKLEKERLPKEQLAAWPPVPKLALGDYVVVTGRFAIESPHHESNSDGLLVFSAIERVKPPPSTATTTRAVAAPAPAAQASATAPAQKAPAVPPRKPPERAVVKRSLRQLEDGNKAAALRQFEQAVASYRAAVATWADNHLAWYGLGGAYAQLGNWNAALQAFERAVKLRPDTAMYAQWMGVATYEARRAAERAARAATTGAKPGAVQPDLSTASFEDARAHLERAIELEPTLWRSHYYLGRIHRDGGRDRQAAEAFTQAAVHGRKQQAPWISLAELYRKWDYTKEAIAVATLGTQELDPSPERSDVFYVLGMAYADQRDDAKAIEAFTQALEYKPDNAKALYQRGEVKLRLGKLADAKADFEAFLAAPASASFPLPRQVAKQKLDNIAAKRARSK